MAIGSIDQLGTLARRRGDLAEAEARYEQALAVSRATDWTWATVEHLSHLAGAVLDLGDPHRAGTLYRESLDLARNEGDTRSIANTLAGIAALAAATGQPERAARLCGGVQRIQQTIGVQISHVGRFDLQRATVAIEAQIVQDAIATERATGQDLRTDDAIELAFALLSSMAETSAPVPPDLRSDPSAVNMTPRELEVLRLLADGRTNAEIADALFVGIRTVRGHVASILAKLDVPTRAAAAAYAVRQGLA